MSNGTWRTASPHEVRAFALEFGLRSVRLPRYREMLALAFDEPATAAESGPSVVNNMLAPLVFSAVTGSHEPRIDLAALAFTLWTATDVLDNLTDRDLRAGWLRYGESEIIIIASSLIAGMSHSLAASLHSSPNVVARLHLRIARGISEMTQGQIADLFYCGQDVSADLVCESVAGKTGAGSAMSAGLGAILAEAPAERIASYERFGIEYGMAMQFQNDLADLLSDGRSVDLANGTRTLLVVWHLETLTGAARSNFLGMLDAARTDAAIAARVRAALLGSPAIRRVLLQSLIHVERARSALADASATGPAANALAALLNELDPFTPHRQGGYATGEFAGSQARPPKTG